MSGVAIVFGAVLALSGLEADAIARISTRARIRRKSKAVNDEAKQILMALSGCKSIPGAAPKAEMMADPWVKARDVNGVSEKDLYKFEFPELKGQANYTKSTQITMGSVHVTKANAWSAPLDFRLVKLKAVEASMASYEADGAKRSVIEEAKTAVSQAKEMCLAPKVGWNPFGEKAEPNAQRTDQKVDDGAGCFSPAKVTGEAGSGAQEAKGQIKMEPKNSRVADVKFKNWVSSMAEEEAAAAKASYKEASYCSITRD